MLKEGQHNINQAEERKNAQLDVKNVSIRAQTEKVSHEPVKD
ncbi:hypothetical protein [Legionella qingyii]|nr:hypothetical protein [Legionella qingyii]